MKSQHANALPLIMTHGWPGSVIELLEVVGPLTDPTAHGGRAEDAFDLVLPSLLGYGFSAEPTEIGWDPSRICARLGGADAPPSLETSCTQRRSPGMSIRPTGSWLSLTPLPAWTAQVRS